MKSWVDFAIGGAKKTYSTLVLLRRSTPDAELKNKATVGGNSSPPDDFGVS